MKPDYKTLYEKYKAALESYHIDYWENNLVTGEATLTLNIFLQEGYSHEEIDTVEKRIALVHPDDVATVHKQLADLNQGVTDHYETILRFRRKDGSYFYTHNTGYAYARNEKGLVTALVGITRNITDEHEEHLQLKELATRDQLTSALNRSYGMKALQRRAEEAPLSICYIDLDNLKQVNDDYGHREGDRFLLIFNQALVDTLGEDWLYIRLGGDEFLLVTPEKSAEEFEHVIHHIKKKMHQFTLRYQLAYPLDFSYGFTLSTKACKDLEEAIDLADQAMYANKQEKTIKVR